MAYTPETVEFLDGVYVGAAELPQAPQTIQLTKLCEYDSVGSTSDEERRELSLDLDSTNGVGG
jgi:hypothetical protein